MRSIVVGLGVQGHKRRKHAGEDFVASVDPVNVDADFRYIEDVDLSTYDAVLACVPDEPKLELLRYCLSNGKHVLVEKPLWVEQSEGIKEIEGIAKKNKVICYTAYNHRFEPHIARLKALLDRGELGQIYWAKLFYGNGTARDVRDSAWRDTGMGVLADLGSHLLDMALFLFDPTEHAFKAHYAHYFENRALDHVAFGSDGSPCLQMEATLLSWRNTFRLDVWGELGSAHIDCLCKWGPSTLTVRKRVFPSGKPSEESVVLERPDPTWQLEYEHFKSLCQEGVITLKNDLWINDVLLGLARDIAVR